MMNLGAVSKKMRFSTNVVDYFGNGTNRSVVTMDHQQEVTGSRSNRNALR